MTRPLLLSLVAGLLLLGSFLWWRDPAGSGSAELAAELLDQEFDYYLGDMQLDRFNADGSLQYHLTAARVTHYPSPDHSVLDRPQLQWFAPAAPVWTLEAHHGQLQPGDGDDTRLLLEQDVVAHRGPMTGAASGDATLTLHTQSLALLPDRGEASTSDPVQIDSNGTHLQGRGMQAWLRDNRIRLGSGNGSHAGAGGVSRAVPGQEQQ